jgi:wyosine [tRNA(Phe)-imidazoG37] synthetase (radical SAM superfamily)
LFEGHSQKYVFGPVTSRRLGESLGIDPVPLKTCNWNCVYCQLGRTVPLQNKRAEYVPVEAVLREVETALSSNRTGEIDWVTFVGSGETLLHSKIGTLVRGVRNLTDVPVAVITNGSLLACPEIREELLPADAVLPTLDAGTSDLFRRINRPHPSISFEEHLRGLKAFAREYKGKLLLEVMLVKGLNDSEDALSDIAECLRHIRPHEVHISLPDRPPAEPWVGPADAGGLMRASAILGDSAHVLHPLESVISLSTIGSALETILGVVSRHPLSKDQLLRALSEWPDEEKSQLLGELEKAGSAVQIRRHGTLFWVAASSRFPNH